MTIKKGEIIGVTGLMGAGKTELGRAISGPAWTASPQRA
jgi:ABC-type sugar transport system ATPase subunit